MPTTERGSHDELIEAVTDALFSEPDVYLTAYDVRTAFEEALAGLDGVWVGGETARGVIARELVNVCQLEAGWAATVSETLVLALIGSATENDHE